MTARPEPRVDCTVGAAAPAVITPRHLETLAPARPEKVTFGIWRECVGAIMLGP